MLFLGICGITICSVITGIIMLISIIGHKINDRTLCEECRRCSYIRKGYISNYHICPLHKPEENVILRCIDFERIDKK